MNRFGGQSSPWASGAPPMYGHNSHAPPPPPQYGTAAYGHSSAPWNVSPQMRSTGGGWGAPTPPVQPYHMQPQQRRPGPNMRPPMSGPTGKRGNQGWEGPPNKRFNKPGGRGGGQGGGNWRQNNNQNKQNRNFNNRNQNRNNNNNREVNRTKQIDTQLERRQQHDLAQKAAESLENKEYPIETTAKSDDDKNKNLDIDSAQEKYLLAVFGYVCQVCTVFLKDKSARFEHCKTEEHLNAFNTAEEERIKKEETDKKGKDVEIDEPKEPKEPKEQIKVIESSVENKTENTSQQPMETNCDKTETNDNQSAVETKAEVNDKSSEEPTESVKQSEEIKTEEKAIIAVQPNDESGVKTSESKPPTGAIDTPTPVPISQTQPTPTPTQPSDSYSGPEFNQNRGRGYQRGGRGGNQGRGRGQGRGRNRGRGRK